MLFLCDERVEGISGLKVTKELKSDLRTSHIPIILISTESSTEHEIEVFQAGADGFIVKPFSIVLLIEKSKILDPIWRITKRKIHKSNQCSSQ